MVLTATVSACPSTGDSFGRGGGGGGGGGGGSGNLVTYYD